MGTKDDLLKDYFTPDVFADAINAIVFDGRQVINPEKMHAIEIETQHVETEKGKTSTDARRRDKAKIAEVEDAIYCLFAIEHQSTIDYSMPARIMEYDAREYIRQIKEHGNKPIKPIITIVMYWEADAWPYPKDLFAMFEVDNVQWLKDQGFAGYLQNYKMHLFEPMTASSLDLDKFRTELRDVIAYVKYSNSTEQLRNYTKEYNPILTGKTITLINELTNSNYSIAEGEEKTIMCEAFEGLIDIGRREGLEQGIQQGREQGLEQGIQQGREQGLEQGIQQGREQGLAQGRYISWVTTANNLKQSGMEIVKIVSILGTTEEELAKAYAFVEGTR